MWWGGGDFDNLQKTEFSWRAMPCICHGKVTKAGSLRVWSASLVPESGASGRRDSLGVWLRTVSCEFFI